MRIIAGVLGGRTLSAPKGLATRPTSDRVREALFNISLAQGDPPRATLDLYAGSGALGLEALSRGCEHAVFVDEKPAACDAIRANAKELGLVPRAEVAKSRVHEWLRRRASGKFGWIFLDPPYAADELDGALTLLGARAAEESLLDEQAIVVAEHEWKAAPAERYGALLLTNRRQYGQTGISFYSSNLEATT